MKAILYYSDALIKLDDVVAWEIARQSARLNVDTDITGYLCFYNTCFFQYIEGEDLAVSETMARISRDPRHTVLKTYEEHDLSSRRFPHWRMRYLHAGTHPDTALERAVSVPMGNPRERRRNPNTWQAYLRGSLSRIANLCSLDECIERYDSARLLH
ncbi:MAG: BLUF domain-containing protein [Pseudomonadota bacterium]